MRDGCRVEELEVRHIDVRVLSARGANLKQQP